MPPTWTIPFGVTVTLLAKLKAPAGSAKAPPVPTAASGVPSATKCARNAAESLLVTLRLAATPCAAARGVQGDAADQHVGRSARAEGREPVDAPGAIDDEGAPGVEQAGEAHVRAAARLVLAHRADDQRLRARRIAGARRRDERDRRIHAGARQRARSGR